MYHLLYTSDNTFPRGIPMLFIEHELRTLISSGQRVMDKKLKNKPFKAYKIPRIGIPKLQYLA